MLLCFQTHYTFLYFEFFRFFGSQYINKVQNQIVNKFFLNVHCTHLKILGLCHGFVIDVMFREMLQNLPYFCNKRTCIFFFSCIRTRYKVAQNEK